MPGVELHDFAHLPDVTRFFGGAGHGRLGRPRPIVTDVPGYSSDLLNLPDRVAGFIVKTIAKGSPADRVGLRGATQIVTISGQEVPLGGEIILAVEGIPASAANADRIRQVLESPDAGVAVPRAYPAAGEVLELTGRMP